MSQLRRFEKEFVDHEIRTVIFSFDNEVLAKDYVQTTGLTWPILLDPDFSFYRAYGMPKGSWWDLASPVVLAKYGWNMVSGSLPGKRGKDLRQLGGNVLVDPDGLVELNHVSANPHDRPSGRQIIAVASGKN